MQYIETADNIGSLTADNQHAESASDVSTTTISVTDLYKFVKAFDNEIHSNENKINKSLLNKDGAPNVSIPNIDESVNKE